VERYSILPRNRLRIPGEYRKNDILYFLWMINIDYYYPSWTT